MGDRKHAKQLQKDILQNETTKKLRPWETDSSVGKVLGRQA